MELKEEVIGLIANTLGVKKEEVAEDKKLYDSVGVDSTEMVELTVALSKHFNVKIQTNEVTKDSSPLDIIEVINSKKQKG